jgi:hypothetical protein
MDGKRFDQLVHEFASGDTSRRRFARFVGAAFTATIGVFFSNERSMAAIQHICCHYSCFEDGDPSLFLKVAHRCITTDKFNVQGGCPVLKDCVIDTVSTVTKCSACG